MSFVAKRGSDSGGREGDMGMVDAADVGTRLGVSKIWRVPSCRWVFAEGEKGRENVRPFVVTASK